MQSSLDELNAAGDPLASVVSRSAFWTALAKGDRVGALAAAHGISVPQVSEESFSFDASSGYGGGEGTLGLSVDTGAGKVAVETPKAVVDGWNSDRNVSMVDVDLSGLCLAVVDRGNELDFRACMQYKNGTAVGLVGGVTECTMTSHSDPSPKKPKLRLRSTDPIGIFAIMAPRTNASVAPKCFSRPVFELSKFPRALLDRERHLLLLEVKAKPRVLKFILEGYPGEEEIWQYAAGPPITPPAPRTPPARLYGQATNS